jgi:hypothetical protein
MNYETAKEIEIRVAYFFGTRENVIVPNVSWGLVNHECDLLMLTKSGYFREIEIKVSKGDLIADKKKDHQHNDDKIRELYFAIPQKLEPHIEYIPEKAGILVVKPNNGGIKQIREAIINSKAEKATQDDRFKLGRLGVMRVWNLKRELMDIRDRDERNKLRQIADEKIVNKYLKR